jgi:hypothetical protein
MAAITVFHHKDCGRCHRKARAHRFFDWLGRVEVSTADPVTGPLRMGEIAVEDHRTGAVYKGIKAVRLIARQIPAYRLTLPRLRVPFIARRVDQSVRGCADGVCGVPA